MQDTNILRLHFVTSLQVSAGTYQLITRLFHAGPGILLVNIATSLLAEQKLGLELQVLPVVGAVLRGVLANRTILALAGIDRYDGFGKWSHGFANY